VWSKRILVPTAVAIILLVAAYFAFAPGESLMIRGESIQVRSTSPLEILGSFYIGPPVRVMDVPGRGQTNLTIPGETIASHGTGGACLIADLNFKGIPNLSTQCHYDPDCTNAIPEKYQGSYTDENNNKKERGWHGYCVAGTCWTRPGQQSSHCLISKIHNGGNPWPTGSHQFGPPTASATAYTIADLYRDLDIKSPVEWRVHACINGRSGISMDNVDCGQDQGKNRLVHDGPTSSVP